MKVAWRARARADLNDIVAHIAADNASAAVHVREQILKIVGFLEDWPMLGREGRRANLRELVVARTPYLVI